MNKVFCGFGVVAALFLVLTVDVQAQNIVPSVDMEKSGEAGHVPVIRRPVTANKTVRIDVETPVDLDEPYDLNGKTADDAADLDVRTVYGALGCAALDLKEARKSALQTGGMEIMDTYQSPLGAYLTTTLFNTPQNMRVFTALEEFSANHVRELQDRCAALEYKDDFAPARWQAVQTCIENQAEYAKTSGGATDAEALAAAFKACLNSPTYEADIDQADQNLIDPAVTLKQELEKVLVSDKWAGTLYSALERTSACLRGNGYIYCGILNFIPNFRWCVGSGRSTYDKCRGNEEDLEENNLSTDDRPTISPEAVSPMQIFEMSMGMSEHFVNYAMTYAEGLTELYSEDTVMAIVVPGENLNAKYHIKSLAPKNEVLNGISGHLDTFPSQSAPQSVANEFAQYLNCQAYNANGDAVAIGASGLVAEWEDFDEITNLDSSLIEALPKPIPSNVQTSGDVLENIPTLSDKGVLERDREFVSPVAGILRYATSTGPGATFVDNSLIQTATICVMRHDLRLSLADYVALSHRQDIKDAALIGYRRQVAYAATRYVLNYVVDKLRIAQMELSFLSARDPKSPPPHVRLALDTVILSLKEKIERMETMRQQQTDYAAQIAKFSR